MRSDGRGAVQLSALFSRTGQSEALKSRRLGLRTYLLPHAITGHVGSFQWIQNLPSLAADGLGVRNMKFLETQA